MRVQLYAGEKHENHHRKQGCSVQAFDDVRRKDRGVKIGRKWAENRGAQRDTTQNLHHDQWQSPLAELILSGRVKDGGAVDITAGPNGLVIGDYTPPPLSLIHI